VGGVDERTGLHTATQRDDKQALDILLAQSRIDPNIPTKNGTTPTMLASSKCKLVGLRALLTDPRVDFEARDPMDQTAEELLDAKGSTIDLSKANQLFEERRKKKEGRPEGKFGLLISNSIYEESSGFDSLDGAKEDLNDFTDLLKSQEYTVFPIENSHDILGNVETTLKKVPDGSITHLQVLYVGEVTSLKLFLISC
jgi:hypothetical protein